jgi:lipoprotein-anchoring transpeptidase ErfK/SrfK
VRRAAFAALLFVPLATASLAAPAQARTVRIAPEQDVAIVLQSHWVFASPGRHHVDKVWDTTAITGVHTRLPILAYGYGPGKPSSSLGAATQGTTGPTGVSGPSGPAGPTPPSRPPKWLLVRLPGRPNGHTGWIQAANVKIEKTPWHVVVSTWLRRVTVYRAGRFVRSFAAIVGKPSTPTPRGEFFVEEPVPLGSQAAGAPFAFALSARSNVFQEFAGGPGQVAIHGINNIGGTLGTAESHGCIRVSTAAVRWLAARIIAGTPVTIT